MGNNISKIQNITIITSTKNKNKIIKLLVEKDGRGINSSYCKGSASKSFLIEAFGIEGEEKKVSITCLMQGKNALETIELLKNEFGFDKANTGIAFTIPVEGL